jgi:predicted small metal-binding protein
MSKIVNCECGHVVRGETDDEIVSSTEEHIRDVHPDLVGQLSRDQILDMSEEA